MSTSPAGSAEPGRRGERCPVCDAGALSRTGTLYGSPLLRCPACGHDCLWTEGKDLSDLYDTHYFGYREDPVFNRRVREVLASSITPYLRDARPLQVLDVGCGNGEFLQAVKDRGHHVFGMDLSPAAAEKCNARGLPAVAGDFTTWDFSETPDSAGESPPARAPFDLVTLWDVCEHLTHPFDFLRRAREVLAPGGVLVLKVPCPSPRAVDIAARVPRLAGVLLSAPSHIQYFHPDGFPILLRRAGFDRVDVEPIAPMRSVRPARSPLALAKRKVAQGLLAFAGISNMLVRALVPAS